MEIRNACSLSWLLLVGALLAACGEDTPGPQGAGVEAGLAPSPRETGEPWPMLPDAAPAPALDPRALIAPNYYVVLDGSGSMSDRECAGGQTKLAAAVDALNAFAAGVPADANLGLAAFDGRGLMERLPLSRVDRKGFGLAVAEVYAAGSTPLREAVELGYRQLTEQGRRQLGYGEYHLVVVTDGEATQGHEPREVVDRMLADSPVILHTIGFCIGERHSLNQPGRVIYRPADNPAALRAGLEAVLAEAEAFTVSGFH
jgi:hypothetical protein